MHEIDNIKNKNQEERMKFVDYWAEYVRTHPDKDWSKQQAALINSQLSNAAKMPRKEYLKMKGELV
ncbi:hypothetical protein HY485_01865 [Candidatus Woesearchaeota archaeon]|nr:hypothetical protein [Candidatus Woesearchaeota archaeon]